MLPSSIMTFWSLTQAPSTFLRVLVARAMPCWTASSKPFSEIALISVTVATLISSFETPFFGCSLTTTAYIFAYHLKGEAKHIGGRPLNTHRKRPIAPPQMIQDRRRGDAHIVEYYTPEQRVNPRGDLGRWAGQSTGILLVLGLLKPRKSFAERHILLDRAP